MPTPTRAALALSLSKGPASPGGEADAIAAGEGAQPPQKNLCRRVGGPTKVYHRDTSEPAFLTRHNYPPRLTAIPRPARCHLPLPLRTPIPYPTPMPTRTRQATPHPPTIRRSCGGRNLAPCS